VIIDPTAAATRPDAQRAREWLAEQRVFISSPMGDTAGERQAVATAVEAEGARPVWFEELGRDADPEEAYLAGVDTSSIYVGVVNEQYGRLLPTSFSATETEYERARESGKRVAVYTADDAPGRKAICTASSSVSAPSSRPRATATSPTSTVACAGACTNLPPRHCRHG